VCFLVWLVGWFSSKSGSSPQDPAIRVTTLPRWSRSVATSMPDTAPAALLGFVSIAGS
jgi:hypothetical protein